MVVGLLAGATFGRIAGSGVAAFVMSEWIVDSKRGTGA